jgi:hypothetical protein
MSDLGGRAFNKQLWSGFAVSALLLAGCNVHSKNPAHGDDNVSIRADENGNISFNLPIARRGLEKN